MERRALRVRKEGSLATSLGQAKRSEGILRVPTLYLPFQLRFWRGKRV